MKIGHCYHDHSLLLNVTENHFSSLSFFWDRIQELLKINDWNQLKLPKVGLVDRKKIEVFFVNKLFFYAFELPFVLEKDVQNLIQERQLGLTSLHLAAREKSLEWAENVIHCYPINSLCNNGCTPLHYALKVGSESLTHLFLEFGADPNIKTNDGLTVLELAVESGSVSCVKLLISRNVQDIDHIALKRAIKSNSHEIAAFLTEQFWRLDLNYESGISPLLLAITMNHRELVQFLLKLGSDPNLMNKNNTPLIQACNANRASLVQLLIDYGADVNLSDSCGWSPLLFASVFGRESIVKMLISLPQIDLKTASSTGYTPLMGAVAQGFESITYLLLEAGVDINAIDENGWSAIFYCASNKNPDILRSLLQREEIDLNQLSHKELTPLHVAIRYEQEENVAVLLEYYVKKFLPLNKKVTPLHLACLTGNIGIVRMLIQETQDNVNALDNDQNTPLFLASNHLEVVRLLLENGADPLIQNQHGKTFLHLAISLKYVETVKWIWEKYSSNAKLVDNQNECLKAAIFAGNASLVEFFVQKGADINHQDSWDASTPLHYAVNSFSEDDFSVIREIGACPHLLLDVQTNNGDTAMHLAAFLGKSKLVEYLIKSKFNPHIANKQGKTPLHYAIQSGDLECVKILIAHANKVNWKECISLSMGSETLLCYFLNLLYNTPFVANENQPIFLQAAKLMSLESASLLLRLKINPNLANIKGKTALHYAAETGCNHLIQELIHFGANPNLACEKGWIPLHYAISHKHEKSISELIKAGSDIHCVDQTESTLLHLSAKIGDEKLYKLLVEKRCNVAALDNHGNLALHWAAFHGVLSIIEFTVENFPELIDELNQKEYTPLHLAACKGHTNIVRYLLSKKANLKLANNMGALPGHYAWISGKSEIVDMLSNHIELKLPTLDGFLPIHYASQGNNTDLVASLISSNDINSATNIGNTSLMIAAIEGNEETVEFLLKNQANAQYANHFGITALHYAALKGFEPIARKLISSGSHLETKDVKGWSFLHYAVYGGLTAFLKELLESGEIDVHQKVQNGDSVLHLAASQGHKELVELFMDQNVSIREENDKGMLPVHYAAKNDHLDILIFLLNNGIEIGIQDRKGWTALHYASMGGSKKTINYILTNYPLEAYKWTNSGDLPIHLTAAYGHFQIIHLFTSNQWELENKHGTVLHCAVLNNQIQVIKRLVALGMDLNVKNERGVTSFHLAAFRGYAKIIDLLLSACVDLNDVDEEKCNALHYAVLGNQKEMVALLSDKGCNLKQKNFLGQTPFEYALERGNLEVIHLMENYYKDPYTTSYSKEVSALHIAVHFKNSTLAEKILKLGANPNQRDSKGRTALHKAAHMSNKITRLILKYGGDLHLRDMQGNIPFHYAAWNGNKKILENLYAYDPTQVNAFNYRGSSPLHLATGRNHVSIVQRLNDFNAMHCKDYKGMTPASLAVSLQFSSLIQFFKKNQPEQLKREIELNLRKSLWHCIDLSLAGGILKYKSHPNQSEFILYNGGFEHYYFAEVARNIHSFSQLFPQYLSLAKADVLKETFLENNFHFERFQRGLPVFLASGFENHLVLVVIWKNRFGICNRGAESVKNVEVWQFDESKLTEDEIDLITSLKTNNSHQFKTVLYQIIPEKLKFKKGKTEQAIEKCFAKYPAQEKKKCAYISTEMGLGLYFSLDLLFENSMQLEWIKEGCKRHKTWMTFMENIALREIVNQSLNSEFEPDIDLIEEAFNLLSTQEMEPEIQQILKKTEEVWRLDGGHSIREPKQIDFLWKSKQLDLSLLIPLDRVKNLVALLNMQKEPGIFFNKSKVSEKILGGSCSAISFDFAYKYAMHAKGLLRDANLEDCRASIRSLRKDFQRISKKTRCIQAAFNTIEVLKDQENTIDFSRNKIQSLANFFSFHIDYASKELIVGGEKVHSLKEEMDQLPAGLYFVRQILPKNNEKLEEKGHSTIYIKYPHFGFFFDPNQGVKDLYKQDHYEVVQANLIENYHLFLVTHARFYRLLLI